MLRKRNRTAQEHSKGRLLRELYTNFSTDSSTDQKARSSSSLFSFKGSSECDSRRSSTSPSNLANSFIRSPGRSWDCSRVGLGLVDSLRDDSVPGNSESKNILLGSQLRLINITNSKKMLNLAGDEQLETNNHRFDGFMDFLSASEDYTCIISHGPNPKTTHIFGDRILESCKTTESQITFGKNEFFSSCDLCCEKLEENSDIYMCRDEKAFCRSNCRDEVIIEDESKTEMHASSGSCQFSG